MSTTERNSGRTFRMLEAVKADQAGTTVVVGATRSHARLLARTYLEVEPEARISRCGCNVTKADGRRVIFVSVQSPVLRTRRSPIYVDHYVWEVPSPAYAVLEDIRFTDWNSMFVR